MTSTATGQDTSQSALEGVAVGFLNQWNTQDVNNVLSCYTPDLTYRDPNTRGTVEGAEPMGRYLTKLFANWQMHWSLRFLHELREVEGASLGWRATFRQPGLDQLVEIEGMDLVLLDDGLVSHNEVQFDRGALLPLLSR